MTSERTGLEFELRRIQVHDYAELMDGSINITTGNTEECKKLLDEMKEKNMRPDVTTYNTVLQVLVDKGLKAQVFEVFNDMRVNNVRYNLYRNACKESFLRIHRSNSSTFGILLHSLWAQKQEIEVDKLVKIMKYERIKPNLLAGNVMIALFAKRGDKEKCLRVIDMLQVILSLLDNIYLIILIGARDYSHY